MNDRKWEWDRVVCGYTSPDLVPNWLRWWGVRHILFAVLWLILRTDGNYSEEDKWVLYGIRRGFH